MAKKGDSSPPPAPDPTQVAAAQSAANIASAEAQQRLNMVGTSGPTGTTGYQADASQPGGYTQYTHLSPAEQQSYDLSKQAQNSALGTANSQIGRVNDALAQPLDLSKLPGMTTGVSAGQYTNSFDPGQAIQGSIGGNLDQARQQAIDAVYGQATSRLDPRFAQQGQSLDTKLANQGLSQNSSAYQTAQQNFGQEKNDAYNQAAYSSIGAGEDAANALFGRQASQGQFANQAAGQEYAQNQGQAQFHNQATDQQLEAQIAAGTFGNQARNQALQEQAYVQNQPINQFSALLSSGQVGSPQGVQYTPSQVGQTDVTGAYALQAQAQQAAAARASQQQSGMMSGLFSLGSAALLACDARLKTDIRRVGTLRPGIGLYAFRYLSGGPEVVGVIAQEVGLISPAAVVDCGDYLAVDYAKI